MLHNGSLINTVHNNIRLNGTYKKKNLRVFGNGMLLSYVEIAAKIIAKIITVWNMYHFVSILGYLWNVFCFVT